ncbi:MAG TPA: LuxR C-terminal-related transcriptional regulator [Terriglobales bacterium]|nr:LuxR C-terminal-related transcriptional regulator [Terriglobales bacterium]
MMNASRTRSGFLLEQWSRGVGEIIAALENPRFDHALYKAISRLVGIDFILAFAYRGRARPMTLGHTIQEDQHHRVLVADYTSGPYLLDPFFHAALNGIRTGCYQLISLAPDHFRQSEYYQTHYHRTNIGDEIGCFFELPDEVTGVLSLLRWQECSPVSPHDLSILQAIEPTLRVICSKRWSGASRTMAIPNRVELDRNAPADRLVGDFESFGGSQLSLREHQIVSLILQGHSTESIARRFDISPGTVKVHRRNIYRKLEISSQAELFAAFLAATRDREMELHL